MLKTRLIPCLLLQNGLLVRSEQFSIHQAIGYPLHEVQRFNDWNVDELIYLDISARRRLRPAAGATTRSATLADAARRPRRRRRGLLHAAHVRRSASGRSTTCARGSARGADKITINTAAVDDARADHRRRASVRQPGDRRVDRRQAPRRTAAYEVFVDGGRDATGLDPVEWAREAEARGAGEILLQIDRPRRHGRGLRPGADRERSRRAVRDPGHRLRRRRQLRALRRGHPTAGASAVAAANIFHFKELQRPQRQAGAWRRAGRATSGSEDSRTDAVLHQLRLPGGRRRRR